jgi:hypothetical protein
MAGAALDGPGDRARHVPRARGLRGMALRAPERPGVGHVPHHARSDGLRRGLLPRTEQVGLTLSRPTRAGGARSCARATHHPADGARVVGPFEVRERHVRRGARRGGSVARRGAGGAPAITVCTRPHTPRHRLAELRNRHRRREPAPRPPPLPTPTRSRPPAPPSHGSRQASACSCCPSAREHCCSADT